MGCGASTALSARGEAEFKALPLTSEERQRFEEALAASAEAAARHLQERQQLQKQLSEALRDLQRLKAQLGESCGVPAVPLPARAPTEDGQPAVVGQQAAGDGPSATSAVRQPVEPAAGSHETSEAHARLLQRVPDHVRLLQLPPVIQDLHRGMPPDIASAPMRLVLIEAVISWGAALKVYEDVVVSECLDVPYTDVPEKVWEVTVTLSWRWGAQKPAASQAGFSPMQPSQSEELIGALRQLADAGFVYVWIDWCCVPQYSAPSMVEVLRSKVFYARARTMLVLPTFHCLPAEGIIRPLLARTQQLLAMADESANDTAAAATALGSMLLKGQMACREYFSRVWTLAERLARYGRDEPLSCWLGLENWLGMLLDSVLAASGVAHACNGHRVDDPKATVALYVKALDALGTAGGSTAAEGMDAGGMEGTGGVDGSTSSAVRSTQLVEALVPLLTAASATGSLLGEDVEGLDALLSELMHVGTRVWRLARLGEAPSSSWLLGYLADMQAGVYQAWSEPDRVWALYSYFSWKKPDVMSPAALAEAVKDLVTVAGGGAQHLAVAGSKLGLGARRLAAIAGVLGLGEFEEAERARAKALGQELLGPAAAGDIAEARQLLYSGAEPDAQDMNGETPLHKAAYNGHMEVVKALLEAGASTDIGDKDELLTPLHKAADRGHMDVVEVLLAAGASKDMAAQNGLMPLHKAAENGHMEVVKILLAAGASKDIASKNGVTPLHKAAGKGQTEVVNILLAAGAGMDITHKNGVTPLGMAAGKGHTEVVKALLEAGAGKDIADKNGSTPLGMAAGKGHTEVVKALLAAGAGTDIADKNGLTPLGMASSNGHAEVVKALLAAGAGTDIADKDGLTPLHKAADNGHTEVVKMLLAAGAGKDIAEKQNGETPLYQTAGKGHIEVVDVLLAAGAGTDIAAQNGEAPLHQAAYNGHTEVVKALLAAGASTDVADMYYELTPLHKAAGNGHTEVVKALLAAGAGTDIADKNGLTPLHKAASNGHMEVIKALLAAGASKDIADKNGLTPLGMAASNGRAEVVKALVAAGARADTADKNGLTPLHKAADNGHTEVVKMLLAAGASKDIAEKQNGETPLHKAADRGYIEVVEVLLAAGADKDIADKNGLTPLGMAAYSRGGMGVLKVLLAAGASADIADKNGETPLHKAAGKGRTDAVEVLLAAGADKDIADKNGRTPLHKAASERHPAVAEVLLAAGADKDIADKDGRTPLDLLDWMADVNVR